MGVQGYNVAQYPPCKENHRKKNNVLKKPKRNQKNGKIDLQRQTRLLAAAPKVFSEEYGLMN